MIPSDDTPAAFQDEWKHVYQTRIGILCGDKEPTHEQHMMAMREANEHVERLVHDLLQ
jgi:hypothetical protein